jgi:hypothetical protein
MHSIIALRHTIVKNNLDAGHCVGKSVSRSSGTTERPRLRLLLFSPEEREANFRRQITMASLENSVSDSGDPSAKMRLIAFLNTNADLLHGSPTEFIGKLRTGTGYDQFIQLLLAAEHETEKEFKKAGVEIRYARQSSIMRIWIGDSEEAAFSFDHSSETGIAFRTRDSKLLDTGANLGW